MNNMMKVICISNTSIPTNNELPLNIGQVYFIDRSSIYVDSDGDAFGVVHNIVAGGEQYKNDRPGVIEGNFMLKHFKSVI